MREPINTRRHGSAEEYRFYTDRYPNGYQHGEWADHIERVDASVAFVTPWATDAGVNLIADLSAGDGAVPKGIARTTGATRLVLGDINPQPEFQVAGALPNTLGELSAANPVDLYVCSETIEHLVDPDFLIEQLRLRAKMLFISTPLSEPVDHGNPEHYWSWDADGVRDMLDKSEWSVLDYRVFIPKFRPPSGYDFQFWLCV